jgi:hypothetical protein
MTTDPPGDIVHDPALTVEVQEQNNVNRPSAPEAYNEYVKLKENSNTISSVSGKNYNLYSLKSKCLTV